MDNKYIDYALLKASELISIDSPTGYTYKATEYVVREFEKLGFPTRYTTKGGVIVDLGGEDEENGIILLTHLDTIGAMVSSVKDNGRLSMTPLGGLHAPGLEGENVKVYTREGKVFTGTIQLPNPSVHVADDYDKAERSWKTLECVLDEDLKTKKDAMDLGISNGDIVALDPKFRITDSGYIKSRFLDDKLSVSIVMALAKYISDNCITPKRKLWLHVTVYEEIGHGGSASVPKGVKEVMVLNAQNAKSQFVLKILAVHTPTVLCLLLLKLLRKKGRTTVLTSTPTMVLMWRLLFTPVMIFVMD